LVVLVGLIPGAAFGAWNFLEDEALVGWWPLDEGAGSVTADISGNGYDAVFFGDPNWVPGVLGTALELDGDDYVDTGMVTDLANFTVAIWVKGPAAPDVTNPSGPIHREANFQINWNHSQDAFRGAVGLSAGGWHGASFGALEGETWYHLAGTYDGEDLKAYTNGVLISTNDAPTGPAASEVNSLKLGRHAAAPSQYFTGVVDDAQVYDRALTEEEIQAIMGGLAAANLAAWENAAAEASPAFFATNVEDGVYDIGELGGEITYEFVVQSNPEEVQASMCLIGRRDFGDTQAGLKYEQWNNTGTYGATIFGVADYDFSVANDPGAVTHLAFVSSEEMGVTDLYVNGAYQGSVASAITLSGLVGIGYGAQDREDADPFFDDFDGEIFAVAVYDSALSLGQIRLNADAYFQNGPSDITSPGDVVQGVPNDGDWPGAETPDLAFDDDAATKYLHFKGATQPTGFQVTPALGATLVTGLTLTTANDAIERDPIQFELYGSNGTIDGPYELIAAGEVADFNQVDAWPRFTMNATPIAFDNAVVYKHYQILFPAVRDAASANSMQIAEVELIGVPVPSKGTVVWVTFHGADDAPSAGAAGAGFTEAADKGYTDLLKGAGYDVVRYVQTGTPDLDVVNAADLVIISRSVASGSFQNDAATTWNTVTAPMIMLNGYAARKNRTGYYTGSTIPDIAGDIALAVAAPEHPIFAGIALADGVMANPYAGVVSYADGTLARGISVVTEPVDDEATVLAMLSADSGSVPAGAVMIAEYPAGATLTHDGGAGNDVLGNRRLLFLTGGREADGINSETAGMFDLYADGAQMFLNAVAYMLIEPEQPEEPADPLAVGLLAHYPFDADASDASGNGNDGTLLGDAMILDGVLVLDGDDDAMDVPRIGGDEAVFGACSLSMWVFPTADLSGLQFAGGINTNDWTDGAVHFKLSYGMVNAGINGVDQDLQGVTPVLPAAWSHMVLTISETEAALYLNGQLEDIRILEAPLENLILGGAALGAWNNGGDLQREMPGLMDEVRIYDRALSAEEIAELAGL